jgi:hypothetical protein
MFLFYYWFHCSVVMGLIIYFEEHRIELENTLGPMRLVAWFVYTWSLC